MTDKTQMVRLRVALQAPTGLYVVQRRGGARRKVAAGELDGLGDDEDVVGEDSPVVGHATSDEMPFDAATVRASARAFRRTLRYGSRNRVPDTVVEVLDEGEQVLHVIDLLDGTEPA